MIDPNFWKSEDVAKLTYRQRLLLIGLFSNADDYGRGRAKPAYIRSVVFTYDDISVSEIEEDLQAIVNAGISIVFYEVDGHSYYEFLNWDKWQTVQKPQDSIIPPYRTIQESVENDSGMSQESFRNDSGLKERKGREEKGREGKGRKESSGIRRNASAPLPSSPLPSPPPPSVDEDGLISDYERDILKELWKVENYPADEQKDLALIRALAEEYPTVELLLEARKWRTYKLDKPLIPGKHNARSQFRTWVQREAKWQKERDEREQEDDPDYIPPYWQKWEPPDGEEAGN